MADITTPEQRVSADELRKRFRWLESFNDEELRKISMCQANPQAPQGGEGAEVFDLCHPERGVLRVGEDQLEPECCYIGRRNLEPEVWTKLIAITRH